LHAVRTCRGRYALLASDPRELDELESVDGFDDVEPEDPESEDPEPEEEELEDEDSDPDDEPEPEDAASFVFSLDLPFDDPARLSVL
jgi:hypothetical protein